MSPRDFPNIFEIVDVQDSELSNNRIVFHDSGLFLELFGVTWWIQSQEKWLLGVLVTSTSSEKHENDALGKLWKVKVKSY